MQPNGQKITRHAHTHTKKKELFDDALRPLDSSGLGFSFQIQPLIVWTGLDAVLVKNCSPNPLGFRI